MTTSAHPRRRPPATPARLREGMLQRVEERLRSLLTEEHRGRRTAEPRSTALVVGVTELVQAGVDRVRPVICLNGFLAAGGDPDGPAADAAVTAAVALEFLDTCLMIRADVHDNAPMRRGIPTLHISHAAEHERNGWRGESRRFGEGTAVLAGDLALAYADRLAARLPHSVRELWDDLRTERVIGAHADVAAATEYLDDPWPERCITGCTRGCAAGWYGLHHALLIGASLAGRADLVAVYEEYASALHAAWRLRGFLEGGPGYDTDAQFLREVVFGGHAREQAEQSITTLLHRATTTAATAPVPPDWRTELTTFAHHVAGHTTR
ncbi:polyprenyl synthetase family protein [Streptomyces spiralis]|nr:polyprenyl synthetase family protein [Streptomyces spiralis]